MESTLFISSYKEISQVLIDKFQNLVAELDFGGNKPRKKQVLIIASCISTRAVYAIKGKETYWFCSLNVVRMIIFFNLHGSILYDYNKTLLEQVFNEPVNTDEITTVKEINPDLTKEKSLKIMSI